MSTLSRVAVVERDNDGAARDVAASQCLNQVEQGDNGPEPPQHVQVLREMGWRYRQPPGIAVELCDPVIHQDEAPDAESTPDPFDETADAPGPRQPHDRWCGFTARAATIT